MNRIFIDLDGVVVDFEEYKTSLGITGDEVKRQQGAYLAMKPVPKAIESIQILISFGFEVWIATKPPTGIAFAYADKVSWVLEHLPYLKRRIILTHDKGLLGDAGDWLIDDRPHKANCEKFKGQLIPFGGNIDWQWVIDEFRLKVPRRLPASVPASETPTDAGRESSGAKGEGSR